MTGRSPPSISELNVATSTVQCVIYVHRSSTVMGGILGDEWMMGVGVGVGRGTLTHGRIIECALRWHS